MAKTARTVDGVKRSGSQGNADRIRDQLMQADYLAALAVCRVVLDAYYAGRCGWVEIYTAQCERRPVKRRKRAVEGERYDAKETQMSPAVRKLCSGGREQRAFFKG